MHPSQNQERAGMAGPHTFFRKSSDCLLLLSPALRSVILRGFRKRAIASSIQTQQGALQPRGMERQCGRWGDLVLNPGPSVTRAGSRPTTLPILAQAA